MIKRSPPINIPAQVANDFVQAMRDYFEEENPTKRDAIAAHQLSILREYQAPGEKPLKLSEVKELFERMRDLGQS